MEKVATRAAIISALESHYASEAAVATEVADELTAANDDDEIDRLRDLASDAPIIRLVQRLINQGV